MPQAEQFNLEEYFSEFADKSAMAEAARFKTLPTGSYIIQIKKHEGVKYNGSGPLVHFTADVLNDEGKKRATVFFNAGWIPDKDATTGELSREFKKWSQLTRALFPVAKGEEAPEKSIGDVLGAALLYPVKAYITEAFQVQAIDGSKKWTTPRTNEEVVQYKTAGYESRNYVQNVSKV